MICNVEDPITSEEYTRDPRNVARKAVQLPEDHAASPTPSYFGPEVEFFIFDDVRFDQTTTRGFYFLDSDEGIWNTGRDGTAEPRLQAALQGRLLPGPAADKLQDLRTEMVLTMESMRHRRRGPASRGGAPAGRPRSTCASTRWSRWPTRCCSTSTSSRTSPRSTARRPRSCPSRCSGQRLRHAHPPVPVEGRQEPVLRRRRLRGPVARLARYAIGGLLKHAPALLAFAAPTHQQLQAAGAGLRGAGQPGLLAAQPLGVHPHPDVLARARRRKRSSSAARTRRCNPYLAFAAHADGGARRHQEQDRAAGDRSTRTSTTWSRRSWTGHRRDAGLARGGARRAGGGPRVPAPRRRVHAGRDRHLDRYKRRTRSTQVALRPHPYEFYLYSEL